jgi:hypothetical protein
LAASRLGRDGFNQMFAESVEETIAGLLGRTVSRAFTTHLQAYLGLGLEEIPNRPDLLFKALQGSFGAGAGDRVGKYIVRKLYLKAGIQFVENDGGTLVEYVEALKRKFAENSGDRVE